MILVIIIGLLALFTLISFALGTEEPRQSEAEGPYPMWYLIRFGAR
jgi:hypothetical protein